MVGREGGGNNIQRFQSTRAVATIGHGRPLLAERRGAASQRRSATREQV